MTLRRTLLATALLAAAGLAQAEDAAVPTGPLPRTVMPSEVAVQLTMDPAQERFSGEFGIPLGTLRRWERGQNVPRAIAGLIRAFAQVSGRRRLRQAGSS